MTTFLPFLLMCYGGVFLFCLLILGMGVMVWELINAIKKVKK